MTCYQLVPAKLPDGIALWQGCQIIWLDIHVNTCVTIYHTVFILIMGHKTQCPIRLKIAANIFGNIELIS